MQYEKILYGPGKSFCLRKIQKKYFPMPMHLHPEFEIILIISGHGKRFIGNNISEFGPGDLVMIGDNVPHFHLCDKIYYENNDLFCSSHVIQFSRELLPPNIAQIHEFTNIAELLSRSMYGVKFTNLPSTQTISRFMDSIDRLGGIRRINALFRILDILARMKDYQILAEYDYMLKVSKQETDDTATRVYNFMINNFKRELSLEEIAAHVHHNPTSLCRYFKRNTKKSIFESLNEIRISYAGNLLSNTDFTVSQIAYESGYRNISHFNKQFRHITGKSPKEYRRQSNGGETLNEEEELA